MPTPSSKWAVQARRNLVIELGGKCVVCGETDMEKLQIDHIEGRDWDLEKFSSSHRVSIYRREAKEGKLQVLCKKHNLARRKGGKDKERGDPF